MNPLALMHSMDRFIFRTAAEYARTFNADVDDLTQAGRLQALARAETWRADGGASFYSYAFRDIRKAMLAEAIRCASIVTLPRTRFFDHASRIVRTDAGSDADGNAFALDDYFFVDPFEDETLAEVIEAALSKLPAVQRRIITQRFFEGRTRDETGAALGMCGENVRRIQNKALAALRMDGELRDLAAANGELSEPAGGEGVA